MEIPTTPPNILALIKLYELDSSALRSNPHYRDFFTTMAPADFSLTLMGEISLKGFKIYPHTLRIRK